MRLSVERIEEAERLLAEGGLSHREIARVALVSRSTVAAIAGGRVSSAASREAQARRGYRSSHTMGWCRECGCQVYLPCYACGLRAHLAGGPAPTILPPADKRPPSFPGVAYPTEA